MSYWIVFSACALGLAAVAALLRGRCRHCGAATYFRRGYCFTCRLLAASYGSSDPGGPGGGAPPSVPAHWTAAGSGTTRMESMGGGGFGLPWLLMSFGALVFVVYFFFSEPLSSKIIGTAPPAQRTPTRAATPEKVFADRRKRLYYPRRCGDAGGRIPAKDKLTFPAEEEAVAAGYRASEGCP